MAASSWAHSPLLFQMLSDVARIHQPGTTVMVTIPILRASKVQEQWCQAVTFSPSGCCRELDLQGVKQQQDLPVATGEMAGIRALGLCGICSLGQLPPHTQGLGQALKRYTRRAHARGSWDKGGCILHLVLSVEHDDAVRGLGIELCPASGPHVPRSTKSPLKRNRI